MSILGIETITDRDWFAQHPRAQRRRRSLTQEEHVLLLEVAPVPAGFSLTGDVLVRQLAPGVRMRDYGQVIAVWVGVL